MAAGDRREVRQQALLHRIVHDEPEAEPGPCHGEDADRGRDAGQEAERRRHHRAERQERDATTAAIGG